MGKVINSGQKNLDYHINDTSIIVGKSQKNNLPIKVINQQATPNVIIANESLMQEEVIEIKSVDVDDNLLELKEKLKALGDFEKNRCRNQNCGKIFPTTDGFVRHLLSNHLEISNCLFCNRPFPNSWSRNTHKNSCKIMKEKTALWFQ